MSPATLARNIAKIYVRMFLTGLAACVVFLAIATVIDWLN